MRTLGVTGKGQQKPAPRLDHQLRLLEENFAAVEFLIEIIDRRYVTLGRVIGDPLALFVLPAIVRMSTMVSPGTDRGQDHGLRIKRRLEFQAIACVAQAFFDETRHDFGGLRSVAELVPIDDRMTRIVPDLCQRNVPVIDGDQPATILGTYRIFDLKYHL